MAGHSERRARRRLFLAAGFRPFFLLAGAYGAASVLLWIAMLTGAGAPPAALPPMLWHAHEMLYGVIAAALAGFLLTAMANWTGTAPLAGVGLATLVGLWLAGRIAVWLPPSVPYVAVAIVDVAFLPVLAGYAARVLLAAGNRRNLVLVAVIGGFAAGNLLVHLDAWGLAPGWGRIGLVLGVDAIALMLAIIGGRIVPAFTSNALAARGEPHAMPAMPWLTRLGPASVALLLVADLAAPGTPLVAAAGLAAAALNAARLARWRGGRSLGDPLLWVLHLGFLWLAAGLALKGLAALSPALPESAALHAIGIGAAGTMILAVMTRATLGHTGRPLVAPRGIALAYLAVSGAAVLRIAATLPTGLPILALLHGAAGLWAFAFALFTAVAAPMLLRPRADRRPG